MWKNMNVYTVHWQYSHISVYRMKRQSPLDDFGTSKQALKHCFRKHLFIVFKASSGAPGSFLYHYQFVSLFSWFSGKGKQLRSFCLRNYCMTLVIILALFTLKKGSNLLFVRCLFFSICTTYVRFLFLSASVRKPLYFNKTCLKWKIVFKNGLRQIYT